MSEKYPKRQKIKINFLQSKVDLLLQNNRPFFCTNLKKDCLKLKYESFLFYLVTSLLQDDMKILLILIDYELNIFPLTPFKRSMPLQI